MVSPAPLPSEHLLGEYIVKEDQKRYSFGETPTREQAESSLTPAHTEAAEFVEGLLSPFFDNDLQNKIKIARQAAILRARQAGGHDGDRPSPPQPKRRWMVPSHRLSQNPVTSNEVTKCLASSLTRYRLRYLSYSAGYHMLSFWISVL